MVKISQIMLMKTTKWKSKMKMIKFNNKLLFSLKDNSQKLALKKTRVKEILKILKISWVLKEELRMLTDEIINVVFVQRHILVIPHYIHI